MLSKSLSESLDELYRLISLGLLWFENLTTSVESKKEKEIFIKNKK